MHKVKQQNKGGMECFVIKLLIRLMAWCDSYGAFHDNGEMAEVREQEKFHNKYNKHKSNSCNGVVDKKGR